MSPVRTAISLGFLLFSAPALAHVVADPNTAKNGAWFRTALRITHGCDGSPTTSVAVMIPDDILIIKPQVKPGWNIKIEKKKLAAPANGPHGPISEVTTKIIWSGGNLQDAYFDEFGLSMKLPEIGTAVYFPVIQKCARGEHRWEQIAEPHSHGGHSDHPAPSIILTPKE